MAPADPLVDWAPWDDDALPDWPLELCCPWLLLAPVLPPWLELELELGLELDEELDEELEEELELELEEELEDELDDELELGGGGGVGLETLGVEGGGGEEDWVAQPEIARPSAATTATATPRRAPGAGPVSRCRSGMRLPNWLHIGIPGARSRPPADPGCLRLEAATGGGVPGNTLEPTIAKRGRARKPPPSGAQALEPPSETRARAASTRSGVSAAMQSIRPAQVGARPQGLQGRASCRTATRPPAGPRV